MTDEKLNNDNQQNNVLDRQPLLSSLEPKKKNMGIVGLVLMILAAILLFLLFNGKEKPKDGIQKEPVEFEPAARSIVLPPPPEVKIEHFQEKDELLDARLKSALVIYGGQSAAATPQRVRSSSESGPTGPENPNSRFQNQVGNNTVPKVQASSVGSMGQIILQGKMIDAVLETAVNSDLPGMIRAIVSHDVYGESGNQVLIPKGSRLIGQYNSGITKGQTRVFVIWSRVVRPDGIEVALNSGGTDPLGQAGFAGKVNRHFWAIFGNSLLLSIIGAGTANVGVEPTDSYNSMAAYRQQSAEAFQNSASQVLGDSLSIPPTITIKQGSLVKVFVAQDLDFSEALGSVAHNDFVLIP